VVAPTAVYVFFCAVVIRASHLHSFFLSLPNAGVCFLFSYMLYICVCCGYPKLLFPKIVCVVLCRCPMQLFLYFLKGVLLFVCCLSCVPGLFIVSYAVCDGV